MQDSNRTGGRRSSHVVGPWKGDSTYLWTDEIPHVRFEGWGMCVDGVDGLILHRRRNAVVYHAAGCHAVRHLSEHLPRRLVHSLQALLQRLVPALLQ